MVDPGVQGGVHPLPHHAGHHHRHQEAPRLRLHPVRDEGKYVPKENYLTNDEAFNPNQAGVSCWFLRAYLPAQ